MFRLVINKEVIDDGAILSRQSGVLRLPVDQAGRVVTRDVLNQIQRLRAGDFEFSHVTGIEEAGSSADSVVFFRDAAVFDRHIPTAKWNESSAKTAMFFKKSGFLEVGHAFNQAPDSSTALDADVPLIRC